MPPIDLTPVTLTSGPSMLDLAPGFFGTILAYHTRRNGERVDWLRPAVAEPKIPGDTGCFPLVPFSNRVRGGHFVFEGREIALPQVPRYGRHFRHGFGCLVPWSVETRAPDRAVLLHREEGQHWPFPYEARQDFHLSADTLAIRFSVTNTGQAAMPAGFGLHPYFFRTPDAHVAADVQGMWQADAEVMPVRHVAPPENLDPSRGIDVEATPLDSVFTGWSRRATISWPGRRASLTMTAEAPLDVLIVFTPPGKDFFCVEPVSNITDAFNFAARGRTDTGMIVLKPGETVAATVTLSTQLA